jgi:hypothetical protein
VRESPGPLIRRWFNASLDRVRTPWRRPEILLVTGNASPEKVSEIERRLHFLLSHLNSVITVTPAQSFSLPDCLRYTGVAAADSAAIPEFLERQVRLNWVVNLDYEHNPLDGWELSALGSAIARQPSADTLEQSRRRFNGRVEDLKSLGPRPVYLFGTGPSLGRALERTFSDGTTVACNTIVRDPEIWAHLNPDFFVAGDAMYHFGHTQHACQFRADALQRLRESDGKTLFVYPAQFDVIVRSEFSEVADVLVPVPMTHGQDPTIDLSRDFELPGSLANVLTVLLLPIGCTLSKDVRLWGFDGRAPSDSGFWENAPGQSYGPLMSELRAAHPAFFEYAIPSGREQSYVDNVHGQHLDDRLNEAEARGYRFWMLHHSWTPTFQKRFGEHEPPAAFN